MINIEKIKSLFSIIYIFTKGLQKPEEYEKNELMNNEDKNSYKDSFMIREQIKNNVYSLHNKFIISEESSYKTLLKVESHSKILEELTNSVLNYQKFYISLFENFLQTNNEKYNFEILLKYLNKQQKF